MDESKEVSQWIKTRIFNYIIVQGLSATYDDVCFWGPYLGPVLLVMFSGIQLFKKPIFCEERFKVCLLLEKTNPKRKLESFSECTQLYPRESNPCGSGGLHNFLFYKQLGKNCGEALCNWEQNNDAG